MFLIEKLMKYEDRYKEFDEYIVHGEPGQKEKADAWQTAMGLQDVDGVKPSAFLLQLAITDQVSENTTNLIQKTTKLSRIRPTSLKKATKLLIRLLKIRPSSNFQRNNSFLEKERTPQPRYAC